jgi:hypothetical protein
MANTPGAKVRVSPALIREARDRSGLSPSASASEVIRYALAVAAGKSDPHAVAATRRGPKAPGNAA